MNTESILAFSVVAELKQLVAVTKLHPILVNFTAALVPVSLASDAVARLSKSESLRHAAWWTLVGATAITPLTVLSGWLFWMPDDNGFTGMVVHKWLGTALAVVVFGLFVWRCRLERQPGWATMPYLATGALILAALVVQGYLGGQQVFSGM